MCEMEDSFDDDGLDGVDPGNLLDIRDWDFWLYAGDYTEDDDPTGRNLSLEEEIAEYEERNRKFWVLKEDLGKQSPPPYFERSHQRPPPFLLSPSKTGFDLIVKDGSPGVGWGATLSRNPRTSSPFKSVALPVLTDVSPVTPDHPSPQGDVENEPPVDVDGDEVLHVTNWQSKLSETRRRVAQILTTSTPPNRARPVPNDFDGNETFVAQPLPVDRCATIVKKKLNNTFEVEAVNGESPDEFNGTFTKGNDQDGTFVLNGEEENGDAAETHPVNATFVAPVEIDDRSGSLGNNSFASPDESVGANSRGSHESICSGVSADSDSLAVNPTSNLGRSMPNLAMKPRIAPGGRLPAPRGLGQIRESALPMPGVVPRFGYAGPLRRHLSLASARTSPSYRSETKLNEASTRLQRPPGMRLASSVANGPSSRRAPGNVGSSSMSNVGSSSMSHRAGPSSSQNGPPSSRLGPSRLGAPSAAPSVNQQRSERTNAGSSARQTAPAADKYATFRKNSSAFNQRRNTVVLNTTVNVERPQEAPSANPHSRSQPVNNDARPTSSTLPSSRLAQPSAGTSGIARPSKLPAPGTSRIAKFGSNR